MQQGSIQHQPGSAGGHDGGNRGPPPAIMRTFIQRDFSEGTAVKFQEKLPEELNGKIPVEMFTRIMKGVNDIFADAERLGARTYCEGCLGCLTAYIIFLCLESNYDKCLKRLHTYLETVNNGTLHPMGLHMVNPMERGLRVIEVQIYR